jgi:uncharacterized protein (UPF0333 family)
MSRMKQKKKISSEQALSISGVILFIIIVSISIYAFSFLSKHVISALSTESSSETSKVEFNFKEYDALNLEPSRTTKQPADIETFDAPTTTPDTTE